MSTVCSLNGWLDFGKRICKYLLGTYMLNAFKMILDFLLLQYITYVNVFGITLDLLS